MSDVLQYTIVAVPAGMDHDRVEDMASKAANEWNKAMKGLVRIERSTGDAQVFIEFGNVNRSKNPRRIAECRRHRIGGSPPYWRIILAKDVQWDYSRWYEFWSKGDASMRAAMTHEFGHIFLDELGALGWHSKIKGDVMHEDILNHLISSDEKRRYRQRFLEVTGQ